MQSDLYLLSKGFCSDLNYHTSVDATSLQMAERAVRINLFSFIKLQAGINANCLDLTSGLDSLTYTIKVLTTQQSVNLDHLGN